MKSYRKELWFNVPTRRAFINITPAVQKCIDENGVSKVWSSSLPSIFSYVTFHCKFNVLFLFGNLKKDPLNHDNQLKRGLLAQSSCLLQRGSPSIQAFIGTMWHWRVQGLKNKAIQRLEPLFREVSRIVFMPFGILMFVQVSYTILYANLC